MPGPIERIIIRLKQSFEIAGGLNPFQIEFEDGRVLNMLTNYKNIVCRLTPLGILFTASIKNNIEQVFITCRQLNDIKKALINRKTYGLLGIIVLKK